MSTTSHLSHTPRPLRQSSIYDSNHEKDIKVLGAGCAKCKLTYNLIQQMAQEQGVEVNLQKVDGKVVHVGSVPSRELVSSWLHEHPGEPLERPRL